MKKEDSTSQSPANFTEAETWARFEKAVDGAVKHGPLRGKPKSPKRRRSGANKRKT